MIQSIIENSDKNIRHNIFILHKDISEESLGLLKRQINAVNNFSISLVNVNDYIKNYNFDISNRKDLAVETFFRLLIPTVFSGLEKILYLDCDMLCLGNLYHLFNIPLDNTIIAAARDLWNISDYYRIKNGKKLNEVGNLKNPDDYFSSGMMLIDIKKFNDFIGSKELLELASSRLWKTVDQDVLNHVLEGKVLFVSNEWNFLSVRFDGVNYIKHLPQYLQEEYFGAKKAPKIIHFAGDARKPWENFVNVQYGELFWKYAARTPFIDEIVRRMEEKKLIGLSYREHVFNDIRDRKVFGMKFILKCFLSRYFKFTFQ
jgi:lipopolysaccharide biosynthesis glycosyltransferase